MTDVVRPLAERMAAAAAYVESCRFCGIEPDEQTLEDICHYGKDEASSNTGGRKDGPAEANNSTEVLGSTR